MMLNAHPDPKMKKKFMDCVDDIKEWSYYDNYQHGEFHDENKTGYGPIRVFNGTVNILWNEPDKKDSFHEQFKGDVSQKRLEYLQVLTQLFDCEVEIWCEPGHDINNKITTKIFRHYRKGIDVSEETYPDRCIRRD